MPARLARLLCAAVLGALALGRAEAAELVMFEQRGCPWCAAFDREIAPIYAKTREGARAPLRRLDIAKPLPRDLAFVTVERMTPVFVLVDAGREIGRIRGYPGEDHFWGLLGELIGRLDKSERAPFQGKGTRSGFSRLALVLVGEPVPVSPEHSPRTSTRTGR